MRVDRRSVAGLLSVAAIAALTACSLDTTAVANIDELAGNGPITVAIHPSTDTAAFRKQVDEFNSDHEDEKVSIEVLPENSLERYRALTNDLSSNSPDNTVVELDLSYAAEFAKAGYLSPLPESQFPLDEVVPATVRTARTTGRDGHSLYAMPSAVEAPVLYYRADLLKSAKQTPPSTADQLATVCAAAGANTAELGCEGVPLKIGDGLAATVASRLSEHGGDQASLAGDNAPLADTINTLTAGLANGTIAAASTQVSHPDQQQAFTDGNLLFLNDGPELARLAVTNPSRYGIVRAPVATADGSTLLAARGFGIVPSASYKGTALDFITFITDKSATRERTLADDSTVPAYRSLYTDSDVTQSPYRSVLSQLLGEVTECYAADGVYSDHVQALENSTSQALAGQLAPAAATAATVAALNAAASNIS